MGESSLASESRDLSCTAGASVTRRTTMLVGACPAITSRWHSRERIPGRPHVVVVVGRFSSIAARTQKPSVRRAMMYR